MLAKTALRLSDGMSTAQTSYTSRKPMPKELTREEYLTAVAKPRRRFKVMALNTSKDVRLRHVVSAPSYWFERNEVLEEDGKYIVNRNLATISMVVDGATSVLFYLVGSRLDTCTFAFTLTPGQLSKAVTAMKRAGLTRLIPAAAEYALENIPQRHRIVLESELRKLERSRRHWRRK